MALADLVILALGMLFVFGMGFALGYDHAETKRLLADLRGRADAEERGE